MRIHPQIIVKEGKKEFVILPYDEFLAMQEALDDYLDLKDLREAKQAQVDEDSAPLSSVRDQLLND